MGGGAQPGLFGNKIFFSKAHGHVQASLVAQLVKTPPAKQETPVRFLGQKDPLEKG